MVQVEYRNLYNPESNEPFKNGPLDREMGVSEKNGTCGTCDKGLAECPGHFGNLRLELPVFHIGYFKHTLNILQMICKVSSIGSKLVLLQSHAL